MKQKLSEVKDCFWLSMILIGILSFTFVLMPIANYTEGKVQRIILFLIGLLFWGALISGYYFLILTYKSYKRTVSKKFLKEHEETHAFEFLAVCSNKEARIIDIILLVDLAVLLIINLLKKTNGVLPYIGLAVLVFTIHTHCMGNGNIYRKMKCERKKKK